MPLMQYNIAHVLEFQTDAVLQCCTAYMFGIRVYSPAIKYVKVKTKWKNYWNIFLITFHGKCYFSSRLIDYFFQEWRIFQYRNYKTGTKTGCLYPKVTVSFFPQSNRHLILQTYPTC